jgi:hypothetical protein
VLARRARVFEHTLYALARVRRAVMTDHDALRTTASIVFRKYMSEELRGNRKRGSWSWDESVAEILGMPRDSEAVKKVATELQELEQPYRVEKYNDAERFERLLDRLERAVDQHAS